VVADGQLDRRADLDWPLAKEVKLLGPGAAR
jgi:hypothetical protein